MEKIRAFIAIELPVGLTSRLERLQEELDLSGPGISRVRPVNIHLTLRFLGDIGIEMVPALGDALERAGARTAPFSATAKGVGAFPGLKGPRVLWVGIESGSDLSRLYGRIEDALSGIGFEREGRPFHPHLTLCRIKSPEAGRGLADRIRRLNPDIDFTFPVDSFKLIRSRLSPKGAIYTTIRRTDLRG